LSTHSPKPTSPRPHHGPEAEPPLPAKTTVCSHRTTHEKDHLPPSKHSPPTSPSKPPSLSNISRPNSDTILPKNRQTSSRPPSSSLPLSNLRPSVYSVVKKNRAHASLPSATPWRNFAYSPCFATTSAIALNSGARIG